MKKHVSSHGAGRTGLPAKGTGLFTEKGAKRIAVAFAQEVSRAIEDNKAVAASGLPKASPSDLKRARKIGKQIHQLEEQLKGILVHRRTAGKAGKTRIKAVA
jgi:hypothetical protein